MWVNECSYIGCGSNWANAREKKMCATAVKSKLSDSIWWVWAKQKKNETKLMKRERLSNERQGGWVQKNQMCTHTTSHGIGFIDYTYFTHLHAITSQFHGNAFLHEAAFHTKNSFGAFLVQIIFYPSLSCLSYWEGGDNFGHNKNTAPGAWWFLCIRMCN